MYDSQMREVFPFPLNMRKQRIKEGHEPAQGHELGLSRHGIQTPMLFTPNSVFCLLSFPAYVLRLLGENKPCLLEGAQQNG